MTSSRSNGGQKAGSVVDSWRVASGLCWNFVLAALAAMAFLVSANFLFAQHSNTGTASLGVQVAPAVQLTANGSTSVSLWIRLATGGTGYLWGDSSTSNCTTPIGTATTYSTSGKYNNIPFSSIPFTSSNAYVCAYDPGATPSSANVVWPHTDASLKFSSQPTNSTAGATITPAVTVQVLDNDGVVDTGSSASITLAITSGTPASGGPGTLSGTLTQTAVNGLATFNNLSINRDGTGYTLTATSSGLTQATSSSFNIASNTATQLVFTTQPGGGTSGTAWTTQPVVTVEDAYGNPVTSSTAPITLAITSGTGTAGSTLICNSNPLNAISGVTTFGGCGINLSGTGYTLTATSSGLTSATSSSFNIVAGPAAQLVFTTEPGGGKGGTAWTTQPVVTLEDANGNLVTGTAQNATLAILTNPSGGTLSGTTTVAINTSTGKAVFSGLSINTAGTGYVLTATGSTVDTTSGLAVSSNFNITVGSATQLVFTSQPSGGTGGSVWTSQPVVSVEDAGGNIVTSNTASVTLAIGTNPGGGTLSCTTNPQSAVSGVVTFAGCQINLVGNGYTLTATSTGLTSATSSGFNIATGGGSKLAFTTQPGGGTGGTAWTTQPVVTLEDSGGNTVTGVAQNVTLAIETNPSGGTLSGTTTVAINTGTGQAVFSGLSINKSGTGYTLTATGSTIETTPGLVVSSALNITVGSATQLVFTQQPSGGTGGMAWTTQPTLTVEDAGGNIVTTSTASVTLAIGTNPGGGTLGCTANPLSAASGVAAFDSCAINLSGTGYTLTATSSGLTSATSSGFNIVAGQPTQLVFTTQPGGGTGGTAWTTQPVVTLEDDNGNVVTGTAQIVTLAILTNPSGGTLSGTTTLAINTGTGKAIFSGLAINTAGTGYVLTATGSTVDLSPGASVSNAFNITVGSATQLIFTTEPSGGTAATAWPTQPALTVEDAGGNIVTTSTASVTLAIGTNPGGGTLLCAANPQNAVSGVVTFAGCKINLVGNGYTLTATSSGLPLATSSGFNIATGGGSQLVFTTQPGGGTGGTAWTTQPIVTLEDAGGNTVTGTAQNVTLAIQTNPSGGTLSGTTTVAINTSTGQAVFSGLSINKSGTGYTLTATGSTIDTTPGLVVSSAFNIAVGPAAQLTFTQQPSGGNSLVVWTTQPWVTALDAGGNTVTSPAQSVTLAITSGTGTAGAALTCTANPKSTTSGVVKFAGCKVNLAGSGYTLTATSGSLTSATSGGFNITPGAAHMLIITTQPSGGTGGTAWSTQPVVTVEDASGNTVTSSSASVKLAITTGTGTTGAAIACTTNPLAASEGVVSFAGCEINLAGTGYTVKATSSGLTAATSSAFNVTVGPATQLNITTDTTGGKGGTAWTTQPVVKVEDAGGNTVTTSTASITLAIGTNPSGGTLTCTANPVTASAGVATFAGCAINLAGTGYTLTVNSSGLTSDTNNAFNITVGAAAQLAFTQQPSGGSAGTPWTTQPVVTVQDAGGNTVTSSAVSITLTITSGTGTSGANLTCTTNPLAASAGVASFAGCKINLSGTGYTLTATHTSLTSAISAAFND